MQEPQTVRSMYRYALEIHTEDGTVVGSRLVDPDWAPAIEGTRFEWWRRSGHADPRYDRRVCIEPIPARGTGLPSADGFRITGISGEDPAPGEPVGFPKAYFNNEAARIANEMVGEGLLTKGQVYRFSILVFPPNPQSKPSTQERSPGFAVEPVVDRLPIPQPTSFEGYTRGALSEGASWGQNFPIFLPRRILDEADALTEQAGGVETGGILIGRLIRDAGSREMALDITAQIPARKAEGASAKLTFTAECWTDVRAAIAIRRSDEVMVGWWHSHPAKAWCHPSCPPEQRRNCPLNHEFFSEDDMYLHRTIFPRAFHCALVVTNTDSGMKHAMFGWRDGIVSRRGFTATHKSPRFVGT